MIAHLLLLTATWGVFPVPAFAARCRCIEGASFAALTAQRLQRADRVALGTVVRIDTLSTRTWAVHGDTVARQPIVAHLLVRRVWRGPVTDTMTVMFRTTVVRNSCDFDLHLGVSYVVFASHAGGGPMATHMCSGTTRERDGAETLAALGPGREVSP